MDLTFYLSSRPRKTNFGKRKHKSSPIQEFQVKMLGITAAPRDPLPDYSAGSGPKQHRFSPYNDNGGSTVAIAGKNLFQNHTIRKVKFLSKNSILTKPQHFHEFFIQFFFDNFSREIKVVNS